MGHGLTTGSFDYTKQPLNECWENLMVAIYNSCIDDLTYGASIHDQATARKFLHDNPYGLQMDFDYIINKKKEMLKCK